MYELNIRYATPDDGTIMLEYMRKLGAYQKMIDQITVTSDQLIDMISSKRGQCLLAELNGEIVGFMFYIEICSAFSGDLGYHIDAFYVDEPYRHRKIGSKMLKFLIDDMIHRGYGRLQWLCLSWNQLAKDFYSEIGGMQVDIEVYRLDGDRLKDVALKKNKKIEKF